MRILELKRGSAEEAELLEAAADAHGDWVMAAAPLMMRGSPSRGKIEE